MDCYGEEKHTKEKIRAEKTKRFKDLKKKRGSKEWDYYFLNYKPGEIEEKTSEKKSKKTKKSAKKSAPRSLLIP